MLVSGLGPGIFAPPGIENLSDADCRCTPTGRLVRNAFGDRTRLVQGIEHARRKWNRERGGPEGFKICGTNNSKDCTIARSHFSVSEKPRKLKDTSRYLRFKLYQFCLTCGGLSGDREVGSNTSQASETSYGNRNFAEGPVYNVFSAAERFSRV